jgi:hypothetical protein
MPSVIALSLVLAVVCFATPAHAQSLETCDARWLDTLRLRRILRGELAEVSTDALDGVTLVITACTSDEAEARVVRDGVIVERRLVGVADVAPDQRARLLALVLGELVRVAHDTANAPESVLSETAPLAAPAADQDAYLTVQDDERPPLMNGDRETLRDAAPRRERAPLQSAYLSLDSGARWFPREWSRLVTVRARLVRRHLVIDARYSRGPTLYDEGDLPSAFTVTELALGGRISHRVGRTEVYVAGLANAGFVQPLGGAGNERTPAYGVTLSMQLAHRVMSDEQGLMITAGFELGYIYGVASRAFADGHRPVGAMSGMTFGMTMGIAYGLTRNGG